MRNLNVCVWVSEYLCVDVSECSLSKQDSSQLPVFPFSCSFPIRQWLSVSVRSPGLLWPCYSFGPARPAPGPAAAVPVSVCASLFLCANHAASLNLFAVWGWCGCCLSLCFCFLLLSLSLPVFPFLRFSVFHFAFTFAFVFLARTVLSGFSFLFTGIYGFQRWFCLVFFMCF